MEMKVTLHGKQQVVAEFKGYKVSTDQPQPDGDGSAPSPFELFLASLATCAGYYVMSFCQQRGIDTSGIEIIQTSRRDPQTHMIGEIEIHIQLPPTFPAKYAQAVVQSAQLCTVKKHIEKPPVFKVHSSIRA